jgi:hypothetical protein
VCQGAPPSATERRHSAAAILPLLYPLSYVGACGQKLHQASQRTSENERSGSTEHECLADFAESDAFRCLTRSGLKALDRLAKAFEAEAESLIMGRHNEMSAGFIGHPHRLFWSAVRMNPGIVSANRMSAKSMGPEARDSANNCSERRRLRKGCDGYPFLKLQDVFDDAVGELALH